MRNQNNKQQFINWRKAKERGFWHFLLHFGLLKFGLTLFTLSGVFYVCFAFVIGRLTVTSFKLLLVSNFLNCSIADITFSIIFWHSTETPKNAENSDFKKQIMSGYSCFSFFIMWLTGTIVEEWTETQRVDILLRPVFIASAVLSMFSILRALSFWHPLLSKEK
jgi:hypothetical protein